MSIRKIKVWQPVAYAVALALPCALAVHAQSAPISHTLALSNVSETVDASGHRVFVVNVTGDLPGVLTLVLALGPGGVVTGGEWALNVSSIQYGPPAADGDGDASETLVQRGVIKGTVDGGSATLSGAGLASDLFGIRLNVNSATVEFAATTSGTGSVMGSRMDQQPASNGSLTIIF